MNLSCRIALVSLTTATALTAQTTVTPARPTGAIVVRSEGKQTVFSATELAAVPHHDYRVAGDGPSGDSATVSGVALWDLLQKAGIPAVEASGRQRAAMYVRLAGADGQGAVMALVEIDPGFSHRAAIVVDRRNGQPLNPVEGPWRVIVPDDARHARWIRGLVSIDVVTLKP